MLQIPEICCDTCPLAPTCEEEIDFLRDIGLADPWGEEFEEFDDEAGWWPDDEAPLLRETRAVGAALAVIEI